MRFSAIYIAIFAILQATVHGFTVEECNDDRNCGGRDCTATRPGVTAGGTCSVGNGRCVCIF
ncbi:hypothetical protein LZ32DRAFT_600098 [Colletotrichum eremochloae]|nr:hypothetical protein LZ32DRAFT_600098 [Colletotrichum eremochloae]